MVGNHVADIVARYGGRRAVPKALTDYIAGRQGYDYNSHGRAGNTHADFVPDAIVDRFCILGPAEAHIAPARTSCATRRRPVRGLPAARREGRDPRRVRREGHPGRQHPRRRQALSVVGPTRQYRGMTELTRAAASDAVTPLGWRMLLASLAASVPVPSLGQGLAVAVAAAEVCGGDSDHLRADVRADRVELVLQTTGGCPTDRDVELAGAITEAVGGLGMSLAPATGGRRVRSSSSRSPSTPWTSPPSSRSGTPCSATRRLRRRRRAGRPGPAGPDVLVPADGRAAAAAQPDPLRHHRRRTTSAGRGCQAALAAGGTLVSDACAPAFWVLADAEGNEVCVCTWQDRDQRD